MKQSMMTKSDLVDVLWLIPAAWISVLMHRYFFTFLGSYVPAAFFMNPAIYSATLPVITAAVIALIYFYFYPFFKRAVVSVKIMFFLNFVVDSLLLTAIIITKPPLLWVYPPVVAAMGLVIKKYTIYLINERL